MVEEAVKDASLTRAQRERRAVEPKKRPLCGSSASGVALDAAEATLLPAPKVIALLADPGYRVSGDIERADAQWKIDLIDARGQPLDLRVGSRNGHALHSEGDHSD